MIFLISGFIIVIVLGIIGVLLEVEFWKKPNKIIYKSPKFDDLSDERLQKERKKMKKLYKILVKVSRKNHTGNNWYYWVVVSNINGQTILQSEMYKSKQAVMKTANRFVKNLRSCVGIKIKL